MTKTVKVSLELPDKQYSTLKKMCKIQGQTEPEFLNGLVKVSISSMAESIR